MAATTINATREHDHDSSTDTQEGREAEADQAEHAEADQGRQQKGRQEGDRPQARRGRREGQWDADPSAAELLKRSRTPMNCKQIIERLAATDTWKSPGGKTPHATLSSAILREIKARGSEARFKKLDRGIFTAA